MIDRKIDVPPPSEFISYETIDAIALKFNQAFRLHSNKNKVGFPLEIDLFLDWLDLSLDYDFFEEPDGASFFANFNPADGGIVQINRKYEDLFESRPDVYLICVGHEVGHAVCKHHDHQAIKDDSPLFGRAETSPVLLHKSSWHQYGLSAEEVKKNCSELENQKNEWVKKALINSEARRALKMISEKFEPEWMFRQAEHFAKCLAIPRDCLYEVLEEKPLLSGWSSIYRLAGIFGVSANTMKLRLLKLRLIEIGKDGKPVPVDSNLQTSLF
jgi:hypothetical protein